MFPTSLFFNFGFNQEDTDDAILMISQAFHSNPKLHIVSCICCIRKIISKSLTFTLKNQNTMGKNM